MKARTLFLIYAVAVAPVSQAFPVTIVVPGNGNEGPLILAHAPSPTPHFSCILERKN